MKFGFYGVCLGFLFVVFVVLCFCLGWFFGVFVWFYVGFSVVVVLFWCFVFVCF